MPSPLLRWRRESRGSAILLVVVLILIMTVVGLAVVNRASSESDAVAAKHRYDKAVSCADAARDYLISQFRTYGTSPTLITVNTPIDDRVMTTGHFDSFSVASVKAATSASAQTAIGASDMSNRIARVGMGGQFYRMTVVCTAAGADAGPSSSQQNEIEYLVRFGL